MTFVTMDDGVRLWTATTGSVGPSWPVVLLHGGPGLWDYLGPVARLLDDGTVVHRFDQRGCGRSDASDDQRVARLVADLEALRRHWGYERWAVVGHSFGALLGLHYAWTHPDRVASLVHLSGTGLGDWRTPYRAERLRRMTERQVARLAELEAEPHRSAVREREFRTLAWFTDHADRERAWAWAAEDAAAPHAVNWTANRRLAAETDAWPEEAVRDGCRRVTAPVTVVHGTGDPRPITTAAALAAALPHGRLHALRDAGHHPWRERPTELRAILRAALATNRQGR
ncbi:alpha/beta fold hydrolase [Streptomyces millisiae]|uniref:Alpha/beta hydrolase n=1 Tax=Streptomyces millisiae TaxID=3075542 RepID=A0ABU2LM05_9ACTN|nr:alpha/beta hydrolase [Streptomyces sp. DSM 44918]MDT0318621.1 alpha/beta hydrolase [Streptomyces sp. DSM 44918]